MNTSEKRVIASLLLLLGVTLLVLGLEEGQLALISKILREIFEPALAGF